MKYDFRRLTPAVLTSLGLIFLALLFVSFGWSVLGWILGLAGLALNVVAVAVIAVPDSAGDTSRRVPARPGAAQRSERERLALRDSAAPSRGVEHDDEREAEVIRDADGQPVQAQPSRTVSAQRDGKAGKGDKRAYSRAGSTAVPGSARASSSGGSSNKRR